MASLLHAVFEKNIQLFLELLPFPVFLQVAGIDRHLREMIRSFLENVPLRLEPFSCLVSKKRRHPVTKSKVEGDGRFYCEVILRVKSKKKLPTAFETLFSSPLGVLFSRPMEASADSKAALYGFDAKCMREFKKILPRLEPSINGLNLGDEYFDDEAQGVLVEILNSNPRLTNLAVFSSGTNSVETLCNGLRVPNVHLNIFGLHSSAAETLLKAPLASFYALSNNCVNSSQSRLQSRDEAIVAVSFLRQLIEPAETKRVYSSFQFRFESLVAFLAFVEFLKNGSHEVSVVNPQWITLKQAYARLYTLHFLSRNNGFGEIRLGVDDRATLVFVRAHREEEEPIPAVVICREE